MLVFNTQRKLRTRIRYNIERIRGWLKSTALKTMAFWMLMSSVRQTKLSPGSSTSDNSGAASMLSDIGFDESCKFLTERLYY